MIWNLASIKRKSLFISFIIWYPVMTFSQSSISVSFSRDIGVMETIFSEVFLPDAFYTGIYDLFSLIDDGYIGYYKTSSTEVKHITPKGYSFIFNYIPSKVTNLSFYIEYYYKRTQFNETAYYVMEYLDDYSQQVNEYIFYSNLYNNHSFHGVSIFPSYLINNKFINIYAGAGLFYSRITFDYEFENIITNAWLGGETYHSYFSRKEGILGVKTGIIVEKRISAFYFFFRSFYETGKKKIKAIEEEDYLFTGFQNSTVIKTNGFLFGLGVRAILFSRKKT